ncbi:MAG: DUF4282 domain-containing protein [Armatimonadetes bacterium]|nr:DUF4282 domain-containing protein [Armatimonadota bacterium]
MESPRSVLSMLFDSSFDVFVTRRVMGVLYLVVVVLYGLAAMVFWIGLLVGGFQQGAAAGLAALILGPVVVGIVYFLVVLFLRIYFELIVVLFKIADNTAETVEALRGASPGPADRPEPA